jgi:hypothetical protein
MNCVRNMGETSKELLKIATPLKARMTSQDKNLMKRDMAMTAVVIGAVASLTQPQSSFAQAPPTAITTPAMPATTTPVTPPATPATTTAPDATTTPATPAATTPPAPPPPPWYSKIKFDAFVDVYASVNYNFPKPQTGENGFRAYDVTNGFAIQWAGLDATWSPDPVGGTISLRFGPGANIHNQSDAAAGLVNVKQAFASWKPWTTVTVDFGKYDQPFGSEVAESQFDINYTRSALYWLGQPLFFTGLRLDYAPLDALDIKLFLTNGWNDSVSLNEGKSGGVQVTVKPNDKVSLAAGYMLGPQQPDVMLYPAATMMAPTDIPGADQRLRHFVDFVADVNPTDKFRLLLNGSLGIDKTAAQQVMWFGANLAARYAFTERFSAALRGEVYRDPNGFTTVAGEDVTLVDGTLTLGFNPTENLLFKLDQRVDHESTPDGKGLFLKGVDGSSNLQVTTTIGVVATTN